MAAVQDETLLSAMMEARDRFMELVDELRPELHRYCARMTGSVFDGEDVVQDTLAKAYYALGQMTQPPNLRPWLFRIAHNTAMDFLKRYERKNVDVVPDVPESADAEQNEIDPALVEAALTTFAGLPPVQRSAIILKDVLGHSLEETATTMGTSVGAVKAALSRARANLAGTPRGELAQSARRRTDEEQALLRRYVDLFNERNWEALRTLLGEESQLDIVSRIKARVRDAGYYDRYAQYLMREEIRAEVGLVDGTPVIAMFSPPSSASPAYFILLEWSGDRISLIRDFRYVPYITIDARFTHWRTTMQPFVKQDAYERL